jgi:hypothetical protein
LNQKQLSRKNPGSVQRRKNGSRRLTLEFLESRTLPSFLAPLASDTGNTPRALAVGDFNGDGIPDLVTANEGDSGLIIPGSVSVLLGNGDGTFRRGQTFQTRPPFSQPWAVVVGHFHRDSKPDFAVIDNHKQGTVSIFLGNGDGTFVPAGLYVTSADGGTTGLAAADLRGNGITDLIVANPSDGFDGSGSVAVLLGNGDGSFQPPRQFAAGLRPTFVAAGDLRGSGNVDLVVVSTIRDTVSVLLGNGDGSFQAPRTFNVGSSPHAVAVGDFSGNGKADLAVAEAGDVEVLLGNGDGTFQPSTRYAVVGEAQSVVAADLTGAGKLGLVTADSGLSTSDGRDVSVLLGNGDGTFQAARSYWAGVKPFAVAVADFTGSGRRDLAVVNRDSAVSNVAVLPGNGDGTFRSVTTIRALPLAAGDFEGDGLAEDLAAAPGNGVAIFLGNGDGTFRAGSRYDLPIPNPQITSIVAADFDGDGNLDLAVSTGPSGNGSVWVLLGNGDGTFRAPVGYATGRVATWLAAGRFRGKLAPLDLVVANNTLPGTVQVFLGNGDGTFAPPVSYAAGSSPTSVAVGDFNGDGHDDLVVTNDSFTANSTVTVLLSNGDGSFQPGVTFPAGPHPGFVTVGDLRGNGILDLVVARTEIGGISNHTVSVLLGNGNGTFAAPVNYTVGGEPRAALVGDFDRDGKPGVAVVNQMSGTVSVLRGNGDGTLGFPINYLVRAEPTTLAAGNFNGDGFLDLVVGNSVLLNAADGPPRLAPLAAPRRRSSIHGSDDNGSAMFRRTSSTLESERVLTDSAVVAVRSPSWVIDIARFFAAPRGDDRQSNVSHVAPAAPRPALGPPSRTGHTGSTLRQWLFPASPWLVLLEDNEHVP